MSISDILSFLLYYMRYDRHSDDDVGDIFRYITLLITQIFFSPNFFLVLSFFSFFSVYTSLTLFDMAMQTQNINQKINEFVFH